MWISGKRKIFLISLISSIAFLLFSLFVNFYAGLYATERASSPVTDLILNNIPLFNLDGVFVFGPFFLWLFVAGLCLAKPPKIPFVLKSIALFVLIRSLFVTLTHIGPFSDQFPVNLYPYDWLIKKFTSGGDLFFSAHTGLPFLMALVFWKNKYLRVLFMATAVFFGAVVLMAHLHYSIDVLSAFFITYAIYRLAEIFFRSDTRYFNGEIED